MKNFRKINLSWLGDIFPSIQTELEDNGCLWPIVQHRQNNIMVQRDTESIFLRAPLVKAPGSTNDIQESVPTAFVNAFPITMKFLDRFANEVKGELGRAMFARLKSHSFVYPHIDEGTYYAVRDRYHLVVDSPSGSDMSIEDEDVIMTNSELWWINNKGMHHSFNRSDNWRSHLIFDIMPLK